MKRVLAFLICALLLLPAMAEDVGQVYTLGPYSFERLPDSDDIAIVGYDGEVERLNVPAARLSADTWPLSPVRRNRTQSPHC